MNTTARWKPVKGFEGHYEVSNQGEVRSLSRWIEREGHKFFKNGILLKQTFTTTGYKKVELSNSKKRKSLKVHRLVAIAFIENEDSKPNINHKDGNPINNNIENLEWCTQKENVDHALETGLKKIKLHIEEVEIVNLYLNDEKTSVSGLAKEYQVAKGTITSLLKKNGVSIRNSSEMNNIYNINLDELVKDFAIHKSNKYLAEKYKTNSVLIATYRYKHKNGGIRK